MKKKAHCLVGLFRFCGQLIPLTPEDAFLAHIPDNVNGFKLGMRPTAGKNWASVQAAVK